MKLSTTLALTLSVSAYSQWMSYPNPGVPRSADGKLNLAAPAPKSAWGTPELSGVWLPENQNFFQDLAAGLKPEDVPFQPLARALQKQREDNLHADDPLARCLPHGVPRINTNAMYPFKIVQTPTLMVILYEQLSQFRQVFMDGRKLGPDPNPSWLGYSTGRFEGDTLVIETSGFNDKTWLDTGKGRPASDALHVEEHFRRTNFGTMDIWSTITDPKSYTRPWTTLRQKNHLQLETDLLEFICNENEKDLPHMVGK